MEMLLNRIFFSHNFFQHFINRNHGLILRQQILLIKTSLEFSIVLRAKTYNKAVLQIMGGGGGGGGGGGNEQYEQNLIWSFIKIENIS